MACNPDFVQFIVDQCSGAGEIDVKKMMGDYCIFRDAVEAYPMHVSRFNPELKKSTP